jgi:hypothetical protein
MQRENAYGLRVSALSQILLRREMSRRPRQRAASFLAHDNARAANFATQKNFREECIFWRAQEPNEAQNARISAK